MSAKRNHPQRCTYLRESSRAHAKEKRPSSNLHMPSYAESLLRASIHARTYTELFSKCTIEVRDISKPAIERNVQNPARLSVQTLRSFPQPLSQDILMRRRTRDLLEHPKKM